MPHRSARFADPAAEQDRAMGSLASVRVLDHHTGETDIAYVVLPARVRAPADLDAEFAEPLHRLLRRGEVLPNPLRDSHRTSHGQAAIVRAGARSDVAEMERVPLGET